MLSATVIFESQLYRRLATNTAQPAQTCILLSPPNYVFSLGLTWLSSIRTGEDILSLGVALATALAKLTPIFLSNVSFRNTVTWKMHETCTWMAVAILAYMALVLAVSLACRWLAHRRDRFVMPVRPDTIAGCMYYLCDTAVAQELEGMATLPQKERDGVVKKMGRRYVLRRVTSGPKSSKATKARGFAISYIHDRDRG